jgi:hypothetical protein
MNKTLLNNLSEIQRCNLLNKKMRDAAADAALSMIGQEARIVYLEKRISELEAEAEDLEAATERFTVKVVRPTEVEKNTKFFTFHQNNSGGILHLPAKNVIVEAVDKEEANEIAQENGVYFNGCNTGADCSCCGDRWYPASDYDANDTPQIYGEELEDIVNTSGKDGIPHYVLVKQD